MGLFQKAIETYDNMSFLAGIEQEGKVTLAPVGFMSTKAKILITLDLEGNFKNAEKIDEKIIIPVTEKSAGRSGKNADQMPHPLCEQYHVLLPANKASHDAYVKQLEEWHSLCPVPALNAVLLYVKSGTLGEDLKELKTGDKDMICWRVLNSGSKDEVWKNPDVQTAYQIYYSQMLSDRNKTICYASGKAGEAAEQHLKGVVASFGNAKIISSNDDQNFTYRGRFVIPDEAVSIGYEASQKAHNALKWLVENEGVTFGERTFVCWNPHGIEVPKPTSSVFSFDDDEEKPTPTAYKEKLTRIIAGYRQKLEFDDQTVIVGFGAATTGRLAVTYYHEIAGSVFLERMKEWDESCCWYSNYFGTSSPSIRDIVTAAFGIQRNGFMETDDKVMGEQTYRLLLCKIDGVLFPDDMMRYAVEKCGNLQIYEIKNREKQLFTTCAIIRKYIDDHKKEEWTMALEPGRRDRSYQYGRLLAVLEKAERDTYENNEKREPNAIRMQPIFIKRPTYAAQIILEQVKSAYYPRLPVGARRYYETLIGEIMEVISESGESDLNRPLGETYLLGYYLQKNAFYTKKNTDNDTEES